MQHVVIDLESLDIKPTAVILSVGAVMFDRKTGELGDELYFTMSRSSQKHRTETADTLAWWNKQDADVRAAAFEGELSFSEGLERLADWLPEPCKVWGNGSIFDISILDNAYDYKAPWQFHQVFDIRTVALLTSSFMNKHDFDFEGTKHHALDDARHEAKYCAAMCKVLHTAMERLEETGELNELY